MPRIRKKTSKRGTSHKRARVRHKVAESHKKAKKEAKKNPQWKSKHPKDPGIPNNFPYKEQVLAEVAEQRRQAEELKQKRKEAKKAAGSGATNEDEPIVIDGITDVTASTCTSALQTRRDTTDTDIIEDPNAENTPLLKNSELECLKAVLDDSDVVLYVLDARDPLAFQSTHLLAQISARKRSNLILLLNKIDLVPRETLRIWLLEIRRHSPALPIRSASAFLPEYHVQSGKSSLPERKKGSKKDAVGRNALLEALNAEASRKTVDVLTVALVGFANTGKSSLINSLLCKSVCPVYQLSSARTGPSTTTRAQEVVLNHEGKTFRFIDTPALSWEVAPGISEDEASQLRVRDVLLRNKGRIDRVKDPLSAVVHIIPRAKTEDLMVFYNLPAFTQGDHTAFLTALARSRRLLKKGSDPDLQAAARIVLRDWSTNKLPWYTTPSTASPKSADPEKGDEMSEFSNLYAADDTSLEAAPTRKEMRQGSGLIKLIPQVADSRNVQLDALWEDEASDDGVDEEDGADAEMDEAEDDDDEGGSDDEEDEDESDADDDEDVEEEVSTLLSPRSPSPKGKRKRDSKADLASPSKKKVAFVPPIKAAGKRSVLSNARPMSKPSRGAQTKPTRKRK